MPASRTVTTLMVSIAAAGALLLAGCGSGATASTPSAATIALEASTAAPSLPAPTPVAPSTPAPEDVTATVVSGTDEVGPAGSAPVKGAATPCIKTLLVDDYRTMLRIMRTLLRQLRFENACIDEAVDGTEALLRLRSVDYALVVSDWNMEPMNGLLLLKAIRLGSGGNPSIPFIMVTAESAESNVAEAKAAGVSGYIVKPFNAERFGAEISAVGVPLP